MHDMRFNMQDSDNARGTHDMSVADTGIMSPVS
jgi:hypothetical protein